MTTAAQYRQHLTDGLTHEQAVAQIGCNAATARTLKSRYGKHGATPEAKPRKAKPAPEVVTRAAGFAPVIPTTQNIQLPAVPKFDLQAARNAAVSLLLISVVIGHAGLVWYDCADRWSVPGAIGGGVVFLIVLAALLLASDETKPRTSEAALWFVFITDFAAWFVHFPVFRDRAQIGDIETGVFAGFLCAASFTALYLYRDSKLD